MPNSDLISRDAAIESLGECPYNWNDWPEEIQAVDDWESHKKALEDLPAVDAAPVVHGRWINQRFNPVRCSVCGVTPNALRGTTVQPDFKFCPYCGAKMDGDPDA